VAAAPCELMTAPVICFLDGCRKAGAAVGVAAGVGVGVPPPNSLSRLSRSSTPAAVLAGAARLEKEEGAALGTVGWCTACTDGLGAAGASFP
jgi:hypothetical protein